MSEKHTAAIEVASSMSGVASKTTYVGAGTGFLGFLASIDLIAWLGIGIAIAGFVVNFYYKRLENKRAQEMHEIQKQIALEKKNAKQD